MPFDVTLPLTAAGVFDDGTLEKIVRIKIDRGNLVSRPFRVGQVSQGSTGATVAYQRALFSNDAGTGTGFFISVPAGGNGAQITQPFDGRAFGIHVQENDGAGVLTVIVDGVPVEVDCSNPELVAEGTIPDSSNRYIITHDDLPEGRHVAVIVAAAPASGSNAVTLFGYLVEERLGYPAPVRIQCPVPPVTLTTTQTVIYASSANTGYNYITQVTYCNVSDSAVTVTITFEDKIMWRANLAASGSPGDSAVYTFAGPCCPITVLKHAASEPEAVNATIFGGV